MFHLQHIRSSLLRRFIGPSCRVAWCCTWCLKQLCYLCISPCPPDGGEQASSLSRLGNGASAQLLPGFEVSEPQEEHGRLGSRLMATKGVQTYSKGGTGLVERFCLLLAPQAPALLEELGALCRTVAGLRELPGLDVALGGAEQSSPWLLWWAGPLVQRVRAF